MSLRRVAIAGAGMAGTSVACALVARGFRGEIVLVDERERGDRARTWCWWDVPGVAFREAATRRYPVWRVVTQQREIRRGSSRYPYLCLTGSDFYAAADARLGAARIRRVACERVVRIAECATAATLVCASGRGIDADVAIDARGPQLVRTGTLVQRFVGQLVRTRDPVFEPGVATLMDFRAGFERPVHFTYVLSLTPDTALIEDTVFTDRLCDDAARRRNIERYVREVLRTEIVASDTQERGALPLVTARPPRPTARVAALGGAGGAIRASSGYAFVRTQRHATALAEAIDRETPLPGLFARAEHRFLDAALLSLLRSGVLRAPWFFATLFARSEPETLVRFLSDASCLRDDASMLAALLPRIA